MDKIMDEIADLFDLAKNINASVVEIDMGDKKYIVVRTKEQLQNMQKYTKLTFKILKR